MTRFALSIGGLKLMFDSAQDVAEVLGALALARPTLRPSLSLGVEIIHVRNTPRGASSESTAAEGSDVDF